MVRTEPTGFSEKVVADLLVNWAWWCQYGVLGPPVQTQAASAEGDYVPELGDVYDPPEPHLEPNMLDGERMENLIRELPEMQRRVLKAKFISLPYNSDHTVAQRLRISVDRLNSELKSAKEVLWRRWNKGLMPGLNSAQANSQRVG